MDELVVKDLIDRLIDLSFAEDIGDEIGRAHV